MSGVDMRRKIWLTATFAVPLAVMILIDPWQATTEQGFKRRATTAVIAGVVAFLLLRYGGPLVDRRFSGAGILRRSEGRRTVLSFGPWSLALAALVVALVVFLVTQMLLLRFHVRGDFALVICVGVQQLIFCLAGVLVYRLFRVRSKTLSLVSSLIFLAAISAWFALAAPTIVNALAMHLHSAAPSYEDLFLSAPTMAVLIACIFLLVRH
jgi:MFS family permease